METKPLLILSDFSNTQRCNYLKKLAQLFQIAIHFHPGHLQLTTLTDSLDTLIYLPSTKLDYYFAGSIGAYFWLFKELLKIADIVPLSKSLLIISQHLFNSNNNNNNNDNTLIYSVALFPKKIQILQK